MGWNAPAFAGNRFVDTPNLDRLAREGVVFTEACASAPNCAPTRACLLTGQYTPRHGVYTVVDDRHLGVRFFQPGAELGLQSRGVLFPCVDEVRALRGILGEVEQQPGVVLVIQHELEVAFTEA
ncbi:MAG: sulfatase-like hydrolase/transferase [Verrucomicrobiota bacterium]